MADVDVDSSWTVDLETALIEGCDFGTLRSICNNRPIPDHLRAEIWQICLNVASKADALSSFDELFDMPEQNELREDCSALVDRLGNDEDDKLSIVSDLESILTFFCKSRAISYQHDNGWLEIVQPLLSLRMPRSDIYNTFYAVINKYIPKECCKGGRPFHLFRLLLQYHEPELCSFLDTKRIMPDAYALSWFCSLFASACDLRVILKMWDVYLQYADPFLVFFLALVIVVNAKDQVMLMESNDKSDIIKALLVAPGALEADDIEDFCSLAQYYSSRTPQSFRRDYQMPLFGMSMASQKEEDDEPVSQALCLPVSTAELLQANQMTVADSVHYFVVDCRPAEQYNSGHLHTAFHLDANLMLQNPAEFSVAVQALFDTQRQAMAAGSLAGGEHLCFLGSGREEEDQYVHMVVANVLQRNTQYISVARGGYAALHQDLEDNLSRGLADHSSRTCIMCNPEAAGSDMENYDEFAKGDSVVDKLSSMFKTKSAIVKEKLTNYIKNDTVTPDTHVSSSDRIGKRYRNMASVFSIGDDGSGDEFVAGSSDEDKRDTVHIQTWLDKPEVLHSFKCHSVKDSGHMCPSHLLVTSKHLYILREIPNRPEYALLAAQRALGSVVKITSKKRHPELITFKYGSSSSSPEVGLNITGADRFLIPRAGEATKAIKLQIMHVLDALDTS